MRVRVWRLLVGADLHPDVRFTTRDRGYHFSITLERKPDVLFDAAALIELVLPQAVSAEPSPDGKAVLVKTATSRAAFSPTPAGSDRPGGVRYDEFASGYRRVQAWVASRPEAEPAASLQPLTPKAVKALGLRARRPAPEDVQLLLTPGQFDLDADPAYLAVSAKLRSLPRREEYRFPKTSGDETGAQ